MTETQRWWLYVIAFLFAGAGLVIVLIQKNYALVPVFLAFMAVPGIAASNTNRKG